MQIRKRKKKYQMKLGKGEELGFYESKNCCFEEGRLEAGVGVALYMEFLNKSLENFFKTHPIEKLLVGGEMLGDVYTPLVFILSGNGYVYVCGGESEEYFLESDLRFLDNAGLVLMTNEEGVYEVAVITDDGVYALQQDGFCATTYKGRTTNMGAFLHGRLYFSEEYAVHCTAPFSFVWETADGDNYGTVLVDKALGRVSSMIVCGEKLLVLQEYGAFFLEGGGAFRDFTVKHIERLGGRAVKGGVCAIGEEIFYLCEDGLYKRLENGDGKLLSNRVEEMDFSLPLVMTAVENACRIAFTDRQGNKRARIFSAVDGSSYESFLIDTPTGKGVTYGVIEEKFYRLVKGGELPMDEQCVALSYPSDFGYSGEKTLRGLSVCGSGEVRVTVRSERGVRSFPMQLIGGGEASFALKGRRFELEIELGAGAVVEGVEVGFDEMEADK